MFVKQGAHLVNLDQVQDITIRPWTREKDAPWVMEFWFDNADSDSSSAFFSFGDGEDQARDALDYIARLVNAKIID